MARRVTLGVTRSTDAQAEPKNLSNSRDWDSDPSLQYQMRTLVTARYGAMRYGEFELRASLGVRALGPPAGPRPPPFAGRQAWIYLAPRSARKFAQGASDPGLPLVYGRAVFFLFAFFGFFGVACSFSEPVLAIAEVA